MTQKFRIKKALVGVLLAVSMVGALVAPAAVASAQTNGPDGMVALGAGQVSEDLPAGADAPLSADDLRGNVYASDHADTLSVTLTTPERAADRVGDDANVLAGDEWALVLSDDQAHAGREVAVDAAVLEAAIGYKPKAAFGIHSSGTEWSSQIDYRGGYGVFHVERFSENAVTFSGSITLNGVSATDGTQFSYDLDSTDGVDNFSIDLTGKERTDSRIISGSVSSATTDTVEIGGTTDPTSTTLTPTFSNATSDYSESSLGLSTGTTKTVSVSEDYITSAQAAQYTGDVGHRIDISLYLDGELICTETDEIVENERSVYCSGFSHPVSGGSVDIRVTTGENSDWRSYSLTGETPPDSLDVSGPSGTQTLADGETTNLDLSQGSNSLDLTLNGAGSSTYDINTTEVTETVDPAVSVNGQTVEHSGTLSDGETVSLTPDLSSIQAGTNDVSISLNDPDIGPAAAVDMDYSHATGGASQTTQVDATAWSETINTSKRFPSSQTDVVSTLTFSDNTIYIGDIDVRYNDGDWVAPSSYQMSENELNVDIGDVSENDTVEVRAEGRKIGVRDGQIDILEPTVEGDKLSTKIEITDITSSDGFGIDVGNTVNDRLHYASDKSFSGSIHSEFDSSGAQTIRVPDASAGSTMTVSTAPISITPESGGIEAVVDAANEPRFSLRQGDTTGAATVDVTYHDTIPGERYVLWNVGEEREVDADRAQSPVSFTTDGSSTTYTIKQRDRAGSSTTGVPPLQSGGGAPLILIVPAVGISVMGLFWAGRRFGGATGVRGNGILLLGSAIVTVVAVELITPRSLASDLVFALTDLLSAGAGAVIVFSGLMLSLWAIQTRTRANVPWWIYVTTVPTGVIMTMETIRPGSVLGVVESVLMEAGVLIVLFLMGLIVWRLRQNQEARTTPDTQITVEGFRNNDK